MVVDLPVAATMAKGTTWLGENLSVVEKFLNRERIESAPITLIEEFAAAIVLACSWLLTLQSTGL